jgi:ribosomal protein L13
MENVIENKGYGEVFKLAVYGMIPSNRLRSTIMKNLSIKE